MVALLVVIAMVSWAANDLEKQYMPEKGSEEYNEYRDRVVDFLKSADGCIDESSLEDAFSQDILLRHILQDLRSQGVVDYHAGLYSEDEWCYRKR